MISIIICSITPARYEAVCKNLHTLLGDEPHEFIGVHDAISMSEGYNRGIRQSRGDKIIVCHDDIEFLAPDFRERLLWRLERCDLIGVAGASRVTGPQWIQGCPPHVFGQVAHYLANEKQYDVYVWGTPAPFIGGIKVMDGLFFAGHRKVFETILFDQETFTGFHLYDLDFTFRAFKAGFRLGVCLDLMVIHDSIGNFDDKWKSDARKFVDKHHASFDPGPLFNYQVLRIKVPSKQQLPPMLRSIHWPDWRQ